MSEKNKVNVGEPGTVAKIRLRQVQSFTKRKEREGDRKIPPIFSVSQCRIELGSFHDHGHARPSITSNIPPITNRGCWGCDCNCNKRAWAGDGPGLLLLLLLLLLFPETFAFKSIGISTGSIGLGSMRLRPCLSTESSSHRQRSSLKATSTAEGRRRRRISEGRLRRIECRLNGL